MTRQMLSQLDDWQLVDEDQDIRGWMLKDERGDPIGTVTSMVVDTDTEYVDAIVLDDGTEIPVSDIEIGDNAVFLRRATLVQPAMDVPMPEREVSDEAVLPVIEEQVRVGKRAVAGGGIRIVKRVQEVPVEEQVTLREESIDVERRPADRPLTEADRAALEERTFEIREHDEEAVVDKQARVVEEVVVDKDVEERTESIQDTARRIDVDVEELPERR